MVRLRIVLVLLCALLLSCGTGDRPSSRGTGAGNQDCDGSCFNASTFLTASDVGTIIAQAVEEARARGASGTIAVVDRVGNVLGVFRMNGATTSITIDSGRGVVGGLEGLNIIPDTLAAIAKAVTGAYLSSEGNAFSTRTASQIVQQNFNPGETGQPAGPLFGVQFSNLPCSDLNNRLTDGFGAGPFRSPLGLSADPGGFPLYKNGTPVGGIGVIADGLYSLDRDISGRDRDLDELIAFAGSYGYAAPVDRREQVTIDGKIARFSDIDFDDLATRPLNAPSFAAINGTSGTLQAVTDYTAGAIQAGTAFGTAASGIRSDGGTYGGVDAFVLVDNTNTERFPPTAGAAGLTAAEVRQLVRSALTVANRARAQIRLPTGSHAQITVSVVDLDGSVLAIARTRDAPIFGTDVSLQKARTAAFFSGSNAAADLSSAPDAVYLNPDATPSGSVVPIGGYVTQVRNFLGSPTALADGAFAFADRSGGNLSRPFFPDGINGNINGPLSKPFASWSPFSTGLQLDLALNQLVTHVAYVLGLAGADVGQNCSTLGRLPNGIQIFPGSVPIYRGSTLVGGIGVSGDGVDQDDMISFLGLHEAGLALGTINNAPKNMRADQLTPMGTRLRFVQCPQAPYIDDPATRVCDGK
ncbi:MAG TPA: heme-binding protein [Gammaproteobacteria bacterium]|nr:heme-binding protein [Gammaproteobacteria bacterium]